MKTSRRQELKTNELSHQIDQVGDYVRQNMTTLTAVVVGAAVIVGGVFWFLNHQKSKLMDGWATISGSAPESDSAASIDKYRAVAESNLDPVLTVQAWLRVGDSALIQMTKAKGVAPAERDWAKTAEEAFTKVVELRPADSAALGEAIMALGVLAEDRGDLEAARAKYKQILEESRFDGLPVKDQASYRMDGMEKWAKPIEFPPPPPPPATTSGPATTMPSFSISPLPTESLPTLPVTTQPGK